MLFTCCSGGADQNLEVVDSQAAVVHQEEPVATPEPKAEEPTAEAKDEPKEEEKPDEKKVEEPPPPAAASAETEKKDGFCIVFKEGGEEKAVYFQKKPLGFRFLSKTPIVVTKVDAGSQAEQMGVKANMEVVSIGGEHVGGKGYEDCLKAIKDGSAPLPAA